MSTVNEALLGMAGSKYVHCEDVPWVFTGPKKNYELRILHCRPEDNLLVSQFRAQPFASSGLHRHPVHTCVITHEGSWGHEPDEYVFVPGTYTYEVPGVVHRFYAGPNGALATSVGTGRTEFFDAEGKEIVFVSDARSALDTYLTSCEEAGLPRPNVMH